MELLRDSRYSLLNDGFEYLLIEFTWILYIKDGDTVFKLLLLSVVLILINFKLILKNLNVLLQVNNVDTHLSLSIYIQKESLK